ncbi:hypothetical protein J1N35_000214 [Gossypium stocksii]|uniref:RNase H type-1 domain-containing protein n=1 Tax=Gossypium stocksii TaxID=47602 RepID=A0A9D4AKA4_9ROSI|nr:hypothetical protein J1N35_000214 [Gossypium stocksii]
MANKWVNLFADGAIVNGDGSASIRGVLRDQHGNWILGFNYFLGQCSVFQAKLWEILDDLLVMPSKSFKRATIQTNNLEVAKALQENLMKNSGITVFRRVRRLMETEGQWCIRYVPRDFNKVADCLAKLSLARKSSLHVYDSAPIEVLELFQED